MTDVTPGEGTPEEATQGRPAADGGQPAAIPAQPPQPGQGFPPAPPGGQQLYGAQQPPPPPGQGFPPPAGQQPFGAQPPPPPGQGFPPPPPGQGFPPPAGQQPYGAQPPPPPPPGQGFPPPGGQPWGMSASPVDVLGRPLAEWWKRLVAIVIDGVIVTIPSLIIIIIIAVITASSPSCVNDPYAPSGQLCSSTSAGLGTLVLFFLWMFLPGVIFVLYTGIMEGRESGQTLGKMMMHICVRDADTGGPIPVGRGLLRRVIYVVLWIVFYIPGILNCLSPLWDPKRQAWHDHAANTVVIDAT